MILDIEQKLDLVQQIHREQEENERYIYDNLRKRQISRSSAVVNGYSYDLGCYNGRNFKDDEYQMSWTISFRLRLIISVLLFLCFFIMDRKDIVNEGIGSVEIAEYIESNFVIEDLNWEIIMK